MTDTTSPKAPAVVMQEHLETLLTQATTLDSATSVIQQQLTQLTQLVQVMQNQAEDSGKDIHASLSTLAQRLPGRPPSARPTAAFSWRRFGGGVLVGAALLAATWWMVPRAQPIAEGLLRNIDPVLVQHYKTLPKVVQDELNTAYQQAHAPSPGQRQGK